MEYVYAALLLHKLGKEVNEENVKKVVVATGAEADEGKIKSLIASLKDVDIEKELENASVMAPASGSSEGGKPEEKEKEAEEKPKEEKKEAAAEGLGALFG